MTIKTLIQQFAIDLGNAFYASVSDVFEADVGTSFYDTAPSNLKGLRLRSGKLLQSYLPGNINSLYTSTFSDGRLKLMFGSKLPYAAIHEFGGTIRAKKRITKKKYNTSVDYWAMSLFFYHLYKRTNIDYYKNLFLKVEKEGFVTIPKRQYFTRALRNFETKFFPRLLGVFTERLLKTWANLELTTEEQ